MSKRNQLMRLKPALIVFSPAVLVVSAIAILNPAALTWPVVGALSVAIGVFGGFATRLMDTAKSGYPK